MVSYYDRPKIVHLDGTAIFTSPADQQADRIIADRLQEIWRCTIKPFAALCPVDWFAVRDERVVGVLELKTRAHDHNTFDETFLPFRKWCALKLASDGLGCPAVFVVRFTDLVMATTLAQIDPRNHRLGGGTRKAGDFEPQVLIPVAQLKTLFAIEGE